MTPGEIRKVLLREHADIRARMDETRRAIAIWTNGDPAREELRYCLASLADTMRKHNLHEEELLREIVPTIDAWGPARAEIMDEEHVKEHDDLYAALVQAGTASEASVAKPIVNHLLQALLEHMEKEEKTFLAEDVLRDDAIVIDSFGG